MVSPVILLIIAIVSVLVIIIIITQPIEATLTREEIAEELGVDVKYISKLAPAKTILHTITERVGGSSTSSSSKSSDPTTRTTEIITENATVVLTPAKIRTATQTEPLQLYREFTFDDGTASSDTKGVADFNLPAALDILAIEGFSGKTITNGTIKLELIVPIPLNVDIDSIHGEFTVLMDTTTYDTSTFDGDNTDADNVGNVTVFSETYAANDLLYNRSYGPHALEIQVNSMYVDYADGIREYVTPQSNVYFLKLEKERSTEQVTVQTEIDPIPERNPYPQDGEISIFRNYQFVDINICSTDYNPVCDTYPTTTIIPAPGLGVITITNVETGTVVATVPAVPATVCTEKFPFVKIPISTCVVVLDIFEAPHSGLIYTAQRGESYRISISDPAKSWVITVPETEKTSYQYSCIDQRTATELTTQNALGISEYRIDSERVCNFP